MCVSHASLALPVVTIGDEDTAVTVEIGGPVNITCAGSSTVVVSWFQIIDGEEKPGTH